MLLSLIRRLRNIRLDVGLLIICAVFLGQFLWFSFRIHPLVGVPTVGAGSRRQKADIAALLYRQRISVATGGNGNVAQERLSSNSNESDAQKIGLRLPSEVKGSKRREAAVADGGRRKTTTTDLKGTIGAVRKGTTATAMKAMMMKGRRRRPWDPGREGLGGEPIPLKIGLPVFVPSLPKSGTTSIWQYFNCGGRRSSHQWVKINDTLSLQAGQCIKNNIAWSRPPFQDCGDYEVFTDTGYSTYLERLRNYECYYPSIHGALEEIHRHYPNATILMVVRETVPWYDSMIDWGNGTLIERWMMCNATGLPRFAAGPKVIQRFYEWHTETVRDFARRHPTMKYIEVQLESNRTGQILEREVGIPARCWGKCTPYSRFCKKIA